MDAWLHQLTEKPNNDQYQNLNHCRILKVKPQLVSKRQIKLIFKRPQESSGTKRSSHWQPRKRKLDIQILRNKYHQKAVTTSSYSWNRHEWKKITGNLKEQIRFYSIKCFHDNEYPCISNLPTTKETKFRTISSCVEKKKQTLKEKETYVTEESSADADPCFWQTYTGLCRS